MLNAEVVTFSTRLAVQPSPLYKSKGRQSKMAVSYLCILFVIGFEWLYSSLQVQLYGISSAYITRDVGLVNAECASTTIK